MYTYIHIYTHMHMCCIFLLLFFKAGVLCVFLVALELTLNIRLALNSERSTCLCLPSAVVKGISHHAQLLVVSFNNN